MSSLPQQVTTTLRVEPARVSSELLLEPLRRSDLDRSVTCRAENTNMRPPLTATATVDMNR